MLLFRSEEHVEEWLKKTGLQRGEIFSIEQGWGMALAWYSQDRREADWRRRTPAEAEAIFNSLGLTSPFWKLT